MRIQGRQTNLSLLDIIFKWYGDNNELASCKKIIAGEEYYFHILDISHPEDSYNCISVITSSVFDEGKAFISNRHHSYEQAQYWFTHMITVLKNFKPDKKICDFLEYHSTKWPDYIDDYLVETLFTSIKGTNIVLGFTTDQGDSMEEYREIL